MRDIDLTVVEINQNMAGIAAELSEKCGATVVPLALLPETDMPKCDLIPGRLEQFEACTLTIEVVGIDRFFLLRSFPQTLEDYDGLAIGYVFVNDRGLAIYPDWPTAWVTGVANENPPPVEEWAMEFASKLFRTGPEKYIGWVEANEKMIRERNGGGPNA